MRINFAWIIVAGVLFLLVSFLLIPRDAQYVQLAIDAGDYDYASSLLEPRLKAINPPVWVLRDAARVASLRGYPGKAAGYLEDLLKKNPDEYHDRLELARLYLDLYEPSRAAVELETLLKTANLPDSEMLELAKSYDNLSLPSSALSILHRIANEHPDDMNYWKAILVYDSQTGNEDDMGRTLRTLSHSFPNRVDYLVMRLSLAYRRGRDREVLRMMDRIKSLNAGLDQSLMPALRSLFRLGRPVDAYILYRTISPEVSQEEVIKSAAWLFLREKFYSWSLSVFEELIRRYPEDMKNWEDAIWLSDRMGWYIQARSLLTDRQRLLPIDIVRFHTEIIDLDQRFGMKGRAQQDLYTWLGESHRPDLADLRLAWQTAEDQGNLPLVAARLRQAFCLFPNDAGLRENLIRAYEDMNRYDDAGSFLFGQGLLHNNRAFVRRAVREFADADNIQAQIGLYFYLANSDRRESFRKDQYALFRLYSESARRSNLFLLIRTLKRFPDLSASMGMELARIMIWQRRFQKARQTIDRIARAYPTNRSILFQASDWFVSADEIPIALSYDRRLVHLLPKDPQGLALMIRDSIWAGRTRKVLSNTRRLLDLDHNNRKALAFLGDNAYYSGHFRKAIVYYRRAVEEGETDYALIYRLGSSFKETGNSRMAKRMFRLSLKILRKRSKKIPSRFSPEPSLGKVNIRLVDASVTPSSSVQATPPSDESRRRLLLYSIKIEAALGNDRKAFRNIMSFLAQYPDDREGLFWAARLLWKRRDGSGALSYLDRWLKTHPNSKDFLVFKAEILSGTGRLEEAQRLLWKLHRSDPSDRVVWNDLIETYRLQGRLDNTQAFDSHIFTQGETQAPRVSSGLLTLYNSDRWSLHNQNFAIFYPGGASYSFDAKVETPLIGSANYFVGRTEYLGAGKSAGWGTNDFTYAGIRWSPSPGWSVTGEAGDTRLTNTPGFYVNLTGKEGAVSFNIQGFDNMIWGDFGESIVRDGLQTGYMATLTWNVLPRLSIEAESWLFDYTLDDRTLPFGTLHTTIGMFDLTLDARPQIDFVGGYEDWSVLFASPSTSAFVPILARQQFAYAALVYQGQIKNRMNFNVQGGGYVDFYTHLPAYEGGAGLSYRFSRSVEVFASGDYFNQSVIYNGASEEAVWGFTVWF